MNWLLDFKTQQKCGQLMYVHQSSNTVHRAAAVFNDPGLETKNSPRAPCSEWASPRSMALAIEVGHLNVNKHPANGFWMVDRDVNHPKSRKLVNPSLLDNSPFLFNKPEGLGCLDVKPIASTTSSSRLPILIHWECGVFPFHCWSVQQEWGFLVQGLVWFQVKVSRKRSILLYSMQHFWKSWKLHQKMLQELDQKYLIYI